MLFGKWFAFGFWSKPDEDHSNQINERDHGSHLGIIAVKRGYELSACESADSREDSAGVIGDSLSRGSGTGGEEFWQIEREPPVERGRGSSRQEDEELHGEIELRR